MWCEKQSEHCLRGLSPRNASPRYTADIEMILEKEKGAVFVSSECRTPFITGAGDICPFKSI